MHAFIYVHEVRTASAGDERQRDSVLIQFGIRQLDKDREADKRV